MKTNLFSMSIFMLLAAHGQTFGMRQAVVKTGSQAAVAGASALTGSTKTFSTRPWPTSESIASARVLGQGDQGFQNGSGGQGSHAKWYQGKAFKRAAGAGGVAGSGLLYKDYKNQKDKESFEKREQSDDVAEVKPDLYATFLRIKKDGGISKNMSFQQWLRAWYVFLAETDDVADVDPELHDVILKIKKDLGVPEGVPVRIAKKSHEMHGFNAYYSSKLEGIVLSSDCRRENKSSLIASIVHEFEHYRQFHKYHGSHHTYIGKPDDLRMETGADAAAAGYFDCPECLKDIAYNKSVHKHEPRETDEGYITTEKGYFSKQDFDDYIKRAQCEGELCMSHATQNAEVERLMRILSGEKLTFEEHVKPSYTYPLKDYLPGPRV